MGSRDTRSVHYGFAARVAVLSGSVVALLLSMPGSVEQRAEHVHTAWPGHYCSGHRGFGVCVALGAGEGITATWKTCQGSASFEGTVESEEDGHLHLRYTDAGGSEPWFPVELVPVRWGSRHYLLRAEQLHAFVIAVKLGEEPRDRVTGEFLLRKGDEDRSVAGLPELPPAYARLLSPSDVKQPITREPPAPPPELRVPVAAKTNAPPRYPRAALRNVVEATVKVRLAVNARGRVWDVEILSGPPEFALAVRNAATRWRFEPATLGGEPISWSVFKLIRFAVESEPVTVPGERGG